MVIDSPWTTKLNHNLVKLPGWRVCWIVGPKDVISSMQSCGSFLEGEWRKLIVPVSRNMHVLIVHNRRCQPSTSAGSYSSA